MKIETYVKKNWGTLPKSTFNDKEVVIVKTLNDDQEGYGHHSYGGIGINKDGKKLWCWSSGCSCSGSCDVEEPGKLIVTNDSDYDLSGIDYKDLNLGSMQVGFTDYE